LESDSLLGFLGPDEGHHRIKHITARNIELINAFIKVHQDISVVQRNFQHRKEYLITKQLPVFVKPMKDTTINEGTRLKICLSSKHDEIFVFC
jgi:hypothetical protein